MGDECERINRLLYWEKTFIKIFTWNSKVRLDSSMILNVNSGSFNCIKLRIKTQGIKENPTRNELWNIHSKRGKNLKKTSLEYAEWHLIVVKYVWTNSQSELPGETHL